jgi:hypothetical protein
MSMSRTTLRQLAVAGLIALALGTGGRGAQVTQVRTVSDVISCARAALGGSDALSAVSSLAFTVDITPDASNKKGRPSTDEITLEFPNGFRKTERLPFPNRADLVFTRGFSGDRQWATGDDQTQTQEPNENSLRTLRKEFASWALMLLLRETPAVPVKWSPDVAVTAGNFTITGTGPDDFNMTLLLDRSTCRPLAATWDRAANYGDAMSGRTSETGRHLERRDLLDVRTFDGIRLPTRIRTSTDGVPRAELKVGSVRVGRSR